MSLKIFLSHATEDKPVVREIYNRLRIDGFEPWLDIKDLLPGQEWQLEIPKAVKGSDLVLVCLSKNAVTKTGYIHKEIKFALDAADERPEGTIFLIPLCLEVCEVPPRLRKWHKVNYYDADGYEQLFAALQVRLNDINDLKETGSSKKSREGEVVINLHVSKAGNIIHETNELYAIVGEALFASDNGEYVLFKITYELLETFKDEICILKNSHNLTNWSPAERIKRIQLLKQVRTFENKQNLLAEYLSLLMDSKLRDSLMLTEEFEISRVISALAPIVFNNNNRSSNCALALDVFRRTYPRTGTWIEITKDEVDEFQKRYTRGLDVYLLDLPWDVVVSKAIPRIITDLVRLKKKGIEFEYSEAANLAEWSIGLH